MRQFSNSKLLYEKSRETLAGGVSSTLRTAMKPVPLFLKQSRGSRVWDVDGNAYIDYIMGYGPLILGHSHPELLEKVQESLSEGQQYGMQHQLEIELSRTIVDAVPCADRIAFSGSGTEAVMLALRLARAVTGRQKIVRFEGHYHGWSDAIFTNFLPSSGLNNDLAGTKGQSDAALSDIIILPWNDPDALKHTIEQNGHEIAAVITEPMMCNSGCIKPQPGYLEKMREWTEASGIVLIFDEVITGFRLAPGGAQQVFGIEPDLTTMGKAIAGGFPLSVVAGKQKIMDLIDNGTVSHLGTLNGNVLSMAAGKATLDILYRSNGLSYKLMTQTSNSLVRGIRDILSEKGMPHLINQQGPVFHLMFTDEEEVDTFSKFQKRNADLYAKFAEKALCEGLIIRPNGLWYISLAHTDQDVAETLEIVRKITTSI